ncbi:MAG: DUF3124 domain-containing protein [Saprospiraceae bacterium]|nr:DUF3124 domain-containing protein [Saprospiraceae bacterium]
MKGFHLILPVLLFFGACKEKEAAPPRINLDLEGRKAILSANDSLESGSTYLALYTQIYQRSQHHTYDLTSTVSMRNISSDDTIYIQRADFYDTHGVLLRAYVKEPIFLAPLETVEIVIDEKDKSGGTGANFIIDWKKKTTCHDPYFQAVMISTTGQQGLSFTTEGVRRD